MTVKTWGLALALLGMGLAASAHIAPCPVCGQLIAQDTRTQDNETAIRYGHKRIEYRCLACALADAPRYSGDLTILAPSTVPGQPVRLTRKAGRWSVLPKTAVFLIGAAQDAPQCWQANRAFRTPAACRAYQKAHPVFASARPLTLAELLQRP